VGGLAHPVNFHLQKEWRPTSSLYDEYESSGNIHMSYLQQRLPAYACASTCRPQSEDKLLSNLLRQIAMSALLAVSSHSSIS
jgi:hypothetical protein